MFSTAKEAADKLRDLVVDPHPRKFREIFTADTIPQFIEFLDPPLVDDPVREAAVGLLRVVEAATSAERFDPDLNEEAAWRELEAALASSPPSLAHELAATRHAMAVQGAQLFRLGVALHLARTFGLSGVSFAETEVVKPFLRDWIDLGTWPPLAWPEAAALPAVAKFLTQKGFDNIGGRIGFWLTSNRVDPEPGRDFVV